MKKHNYYLVPALGVLLVAAVLIGCSRAPSHQQVLDRVKTETARVLNSDVSKLNVAAPLAKMGAGKLEAAQIVIAVEETFKVEVLDETVSESGEDAMAKLSINQIASLIENKLKQKPA